MTRVFLLSDTHAWLDPALDEYFEHCDEIWHAGDIGSLELLFKLRAKAEVVRAVYGNIDSAEIRRESREYISWTCETMDILMIHIGGYPPTYNARSRELIEEYQPDLFICGHSHILKIMPDKKHELLHINPGATGYIGFHKKRTAVQFIVDGDRIRELEVLELGPRGTVDVPSE